MKAIIKNGVANKDIQSCLISECGVEITFHNNDLADKFALSLNLSGIPCVNNGNKITISYIDQLSVRARLTQLSTSSASCVLDCWRDNWQSGKTDKLILLVDGVV